MKRCELKNCCPYQYLLVAHLVTLVIGFGYLSQILERWQGPMNAVSHSVRVATAQGKQGIWFLLFPDRENTGNFVVAQSKFLRQENFF